MTRADYGLDAPGVVRMLAILGAVQIVIAVAAVFFFPGLRFLIWPGSSMALTAVLMILSSRVGKMRARDRLLDALQLRGDEHLLDVGCGHGLLLIGAAKRLANGRAVGLDLWSQVDQMNNARADTLRNAEIERAKVEVVDGDMTQMPFDDAAFDVVVASLSIHNVPTREGRRKAVREIARVLKPGGKVALLDFQKTGDYAATLRDAGFTRVERTWPTFLIFPPARTVLGTK